MPSDSDPFAIALADAVVSAIRDAITHDAPDAVAYALAEPECYCDAVPNHYADGHAYGHAHIRPHHVANALGLYWGEQPHHGDNQRD